MTFYKTFEEAAKTLTVTSRDSCHEVSILGPSKVIYGGSDKALLPCGARVVVETECEVENVR